MTTDRIPLVGGTGGMLLDTRGSYTRSSCQESLAGPWKTRFRPIFAKRHPPAKAKNGTSMKRGEEAGS